MITQDVKNKLNSSIRIPIWSLSIIIPLVSGLAGHSISQAVKWNNIELSQKSIVRSQEDLYNFVEKFVNKVDESLKLKADIREINTMYKSFERLDKSIERLEIKIDKLTNERRK